MHHRAVKTTFSRVEVIYTISHFDLPLQEDIFLITFELLLTIGFLLVLIRISVMKMKSITMMQQFYTMEKDGISI